MKTRKILPALISICCTYLSFAQTGGISQTCKIKYDYDAAGNRIARYESCTGGVGGGGGNKTDEVTTEALLSDESEETIRAQKDDLDITVLFPNPTSSACIVSLNKEVTGATLMLVDNQGKKLYTMRVSGKDIPLDLSGFSSGTYFVLIRTETKTVNKIVVKN